MMCYNHISAHDTRDKQHKLRQTKLVVIDKHVSPNNHGPFASLSQSEHFDQRMEMPLRTTMLSILQYPNHHQGHQQNAPRLYSKSIHFDLLYSFPSPLPASTTNVPPALLIDHTALVIFRFCQWLVFLTGIHRPDRRHIRSMHNRWRWDRRCNVEFPSLSAKRRDLLPQPLLPMSPRNILLQHRRPHPLRIKLISNLLIDPPNTFLRQVPQHSVRGHDIQILLQSYDRINIRLRGSVWSRPRPRRPHRLIVGSVHEVLHILLCQRIALFIRMPHQLPQSADPQLRDRAVIPFQIEHRAVRGHDAQTLLLV